MKPFAKIIYAILLFYVKCEKSQLKELTLFFYKSVLLSEHGSCFCIHPLFYRCHPELSEGSRQKVHVILFRDSISKAGMTALNSDLSSRRSEATERSMNYFK
jgi:hypothetical protein